MLSVKFLASWSAYLVITFALGFLWHLVLFKGVYRRLAIFTRIDDPIVPLGFLAMVVQGAVLAYVYPQFARGTSPALEGVTFGLVMGLFIASSAVIAEAAKQRVTSLTTWLMVESAYYLIQFPLSGLAIGLIYGDMGQGA